MRRASKNSGMGRRGRFSSRNSLKRAWVGFTSSRKRSSKALETLLVVLVAAGEMRRDIGSGISFSRRIIRTQGQPAFLIAGNRMMTLSTNQVRL